MNFQTHSGYGYGTDFVVNLHREFFHFKISKYVTKNSQKKRAVRHKQVND